MAFWCFTEVTDLGRYFSTQGWVEEESTAAGGTGSRSISMESSRTMGSSELAGKGGIVGAEVGRRGVGEEGGVSGCLLSRVRWGRAGD